MANEPITIGAFSLRPTSTGTGFFVEGPTIDIKDDLKERGGRWNVAIKSWWFNNAKRDSIVKYLKSLTRIAAAASSPSPSPSPSPRPAPAHASTSTSTSTFSTFPIKAGKFELTAPKTGTGFFVSGVPAETFAIKDKLLALGGRWNSYVKKFYFPREKLSDVKSALEGVDAKPRRHSEILRESGRDKLKTLDELLDSLDETDVKNIVALTPEEIDYLVTIIGLSKKTTDLSDNRKIRLVIEELASRLCRCIKDIDRPESTAIPICISRIFNSRGLKISTFKCTDGELLLPRSGSKIVLGRQPRIKTIIR